ncbi:MAG: hypothetical protein IPI50_05635 [Saprospiraceae bacterium]|nr:hypothetical protein [Saprospiraceae bacterium]
MKFKNILLLLAIILPILGTGQSGLVVSAGVSTLKTEYPLVNQSGFWNRGWHLGLTTRLGKDFWYGKVGLELHKIELAGNNRIEIFTDVPSAYFLKFPLQIGARIIKLSGFQLHAMGGLQVTYTAHIDKNPLGLNHGRIRDFTAGWLGNIGIDLGVFTVDVGYEYGLTELYTDTKYRANYWFISGGFFF